jgi:hypothetical protein
MPIVTGNPIGLLLALTYTVGGGGPVTLTIQDSWHAHFADGPVDIEPFGYGSNDFVEQWWEEWIIKKRGKRRNIMYSRRRYP